MLRRIPTGRSREIVIRSVEPGDLEGITALYEGLSDEDRYRRFFSEYHPNHRFFERIVTATTRGDLEVVALAGDASGPARVVAEAGYNLLPNGDGELAVVVEHGRRGWLGPYLVDVVVEEAAAHGLAVIQADVLATNGPMLALLHARRPLSFERVDGAILRARIATGQRLTTSP